MFATLLCLVQVQAAQAPADTHKIPRMPHAPIVRNKDVDYGIPRGEDKPIELIIGPRAQTPSYSHRVIDVPALWKVCPTRGRGIKVAVLDTGIDGQHFDLAGQVVKEIDFSGSGSPRDKVGHGTHCSGIIAALDNDTGVVGVAPEAKLYNVKVLGDSGSGSSLNIAKGIRWAVDNGADVISMSLGGPQPDSATREAVQYATSKGVYVIAAAGNEGPSDNTVGYPGRYDECICVASSNEAGNVSNFSSRGTQVDITAPGEQILSTYPNERLATLSGTSMATPFVAGCVAVLIGDCDAKGIKRPTPVALMEQLQKYSVDLPPPGKDVASGAGVIAPAKAVFSGPDNPPPPVPSPVTDLVITLDDFTDSARKRILDADPNFQGLIVKRKSGDSIVGDVDEIQVPSGADFFRIRVKGLVYEIPYSVSPLKPEWFLQKLTVILEVKNGKVIKASFSQREAVF